MKRRWIWVLTAALLMGASPASGTVVYPSGQWLNPGDLYADSVLMTSYALGVGLSATVEWSDVSVSFERLQKSSGMAGSSPVSEDRTDFWVVPPLQKAGETFVLLDPTYSFTLEETEPFQVEIFEQELGDQPFVPTPSLFLYGVDEGEPILCCDVLEEAVSGLRHALPVELVEALVPPGEHNGCLRVTEAGLYLWVDLDELSRSGTSSPYSYNASAPAFRPTINPGYTDYSLALPVGWLTGDPVACVTVERMDWRDQSVQEFSLCPVDFGGEFSALFGPEAVLWPLKLPSPLECGLSESSTLDPSGNQLAITAQEWCSIYRPQCEVQRNSTGGVDVHSEELEEACSPCSEYYRINWDNLSHADTGTQTTNDGCSWSGPRRGSRGAPWLFLLAAGLLCRARGRGLVFNSR